MPWFLDVLRCLPEVGFYAICAGVVCAETALLPLFFLPSLSVLFCGGLLARLGVTNMGTTISVAFVFAVAGDAIGWYMGSSLGSRWVGRLARGGRAARMWGRTEGLISRRGPQAVFLCRFIPLARTAAPHLAGVAGVGYRAIAPWSMGAAALWSSAEVTAGYLSGATFPGAADALG